jgi:hypothetical protein
MLYSNQVFPENFTILAIDKEEIHAETVSDNGGFPVPQHYGGLEYTICDTI